MTPERKYIHTSHYPCCFAFLVFVLSALLFALPERATLFTPSDAPVSNSIGDMVFDGNCLWVATGEGLSRACAGEIVWQHFLDGKSFSALCYAYGRIIAATAYDTIIGGESYPLGGGIEMTFTETESLNWTTLEPWQMTYSLDINLPGMLSYDIVAVADEEDTALWSANWYGGLSRSYDWGESWENILWSDSSYTVADSGYIVRTSIYPDRDSILAFYIENGSYHHRLLYAVCADTAAIPPIIFAGTASGIFSIQDTFWRRYRADTATGLTGNWCVALSVQYLQSGGRVIWAASRQVPDHSGEVDGICYSTDDGETWDTLATYIMCWNFAFGCGDKAFFACEQGLYRSDVVNAGDSIYATSFEKIDIVDNESGFVLPLDEMISVAVIGDTVWAGSDFGIAFSPNCGNTWKIVLHRDAPDWSKTYAFPSPFSPTTHGTMFFVFNNPILGDVKLSIFDFALDEVVSTLKTLPAGTKQMIQWDGIDKNGDYPANGIYHYRITLPDGTEMWGKFALIK